MFHRGVLSQAHNYFLKILSNSINEQPKAFRAITMRSLFFYFFEQKNNVKCNLMQDAGVKVNRLAASG
ncbi:hypothetical protein C7N43_32415 [Sphingobacteriales bacterium UPWRP_1]|nr:hypothetical protein BVG80_06290 [Sphingobacteriales bacterium TSM_CSM]PSJ72810.1 hypothetical protein C7N43_32415 [Sphingobacteriales bacterium UPWRP_1]